MNSAADVERSILRYWLTAIYLQWRILIGPLGKADDVVVPRNVIFGIRHSLTKHFVLFPKQRLSHSFPSVYQSAYANAGTEHVSNVVLTFVFFCDENVCDGEVSASVPIGGGFLLKVPRRKGRG